MSQYRTSRVFDVIFILVLAFGLFMAYSHRVALGDWAFFLTNQPKTETIQLADDAGLGAYGRKLLYRTDPQITTKAIIAQNCDIEDLGCITPRGVVYIQASDDHADQVVTAAHEMLHMAYRRLSPSDKKTANDLISQTIEQLNSSALEEELSNQPDQAGRLDEAHSLLGTEYPDLPPALEKYYSRYFTDRSKVLAANVASQQ